MGFNFLRVSFLLAVQVIGLSLGHTLHFGRTCPNVQAFPNLSINKVLGTWYVAYKTDTDNNCLVWNVTASPVADQILVTETRQLSFFDLLKVDHRHSITGTVKIPNPEVPSKMRIKWPTSLTGEADFIIFDTDYDTYMAIFECNRAGIVHRRSVMLLFRNLDKQLDKLFLSRIHRLLKGAGVSHHSMDSIDHGACRDKGKYHWKTGEPNLEDLKNQRRSDDVVDYDLSEIEILGEGVSEFSQDSFRGSLKKDTKPVL